MSARYTSPDLSRQLAAAGLAQAEREMVWCACRCASVDGAFRLKNDCHVCREYSVEPGQSAPCLHPSHVRALRLDDVLEELTRDRDGGPLCTDYTLNHLSAISLNGEDFARACSSFVGRRPGGSGGSNIQEAGGTDIEAAALVLLALLRERGGK